MRMPVPTAAQQAGPATHSGELSCVSSPYLYASLRDRPGNRPLNGATRLPEAGPGDEADICNV